MQWKERFETLQHDFDEFRNNSKVVEEELESETVELRSEVTDLHEQLRRALKGKGPEMKAMDKLIAKIQVLTKVRDELLVKNRSLENRNDQLSCGLRAKTSRVEDLEEEVETRQETIVILQEQLEQIKEDSATADEKPDSSPSKLKIPGSENERGFEMLKAENKSLYELIDKLKATNVECEYCVELEARIEEQNEEIEELEDVHNELTSKLEDLQNELNEKDDIQSTVVPPIVTDQSEAPGVVQDKTRSAAETTRSCDTPKGNEKQFSTRGNLESRSSSSTELDVVGKSLDSLYEDLEDINSPGAQADLKFKIARLSEDKELLKRKLADLVTASENLQKYTIVQFDIEPEVVQPQLNLAVVLATNIEPTARVFNELHGCTAAYIEVEPQENLSHKRSDIITNLAISDNTERNFRSLPDDSEYYWKSSAFKRPKLQQSSGAFIQIMPGGLSEEMQTKMDQQRRVSIKLRKQVDKMETLSSDMLTVGFETEKAMIEKRLSKLDEEKDELKDWIVELNDVKAILKTAKLSFKTESPMVQNKLMELELNSPKARNKIKHLECQIKEDDEDLQSSIKNLENVIMDKDAQIESIKKVLKQNEVNVCSAKNELEATRNVAIMHQATTNLLWNETEHFQILAIEALERTLKLLKEKLTTNNEGIIKTISSKKQLLEKSQNLSSGYGARITAFKKENVSSLADSIEEVETLKLKLRKKSSEIRALAGLMEHKPCTSEVSTSTKSEKLTVKAGLLSMRSHLRALGDEVQASKLSNIRVNILDQENASLKEVFSKIDSNIESLATEADFQEKNVEHLRINQAISRRLCAINQTLQNSIETHKKEIDHLEKTHEEEVNTLLSKLTSNLNDGKYNNDELIKLLQEEVRNNRIKTRSNPGGSRTKKMGELHNKENRLNSGESAVIELDNSPAKNKHAIQFAERRKNYTFISRFNNALSSPRNKAPLALSLITTEISIPSKRMKLLQGSAGSLSPNWRKKHRSERKKHWNVNSSNHMKELEMYLNRLKDDIQRKSRTPDYDQDSTETTDSTISKLATWLKMGMEIREASKGTISELSSLIQDTKVMAAYLTKGFLEIAKLLSTVSSPDDLGVQLHLVKKQLSEEMALRRKIFDELKMVKGHIRVYCRVRPLLESEKINGVEHSVDFRSHDSVTVFTGKSVLGGGTGEKQHTFSFDRCFDDHKTQSDIFEDLKGSILNVLDGFHVCVFAYGMTGSGKTYTIEGPKGNRGIRERSFQKLFTYMRNKKREFEFEVHVSLLEIYNNQLRDLLVEIRDRKSILKIYRDKKTGMTEVANLTKIPVTSLEEVLKVLMKGSQTRIVGATDANHRSSRSHMIATTYFRATSRRTRTTTIGRLNLIDLAGSERLKHSNATGERLSEAVQINKSLAALGDVMRALEKQQADKEVHVPYRNSKLTQLLQNSLENSITYMIINISPSSSHVQETIQSLQFAKRVKAIKIGQATTSQQSKKFTKTNNELRELSSKNKTLIKSLREMRSKNKVLATDIESLRESLKVELTNGKKEIRALQETITFQKAASQKHVKAMEKNQILDKSVNSWKRKYEILVKKYFIKTGEVETLTHKMRNYEHEIIRVQQQSSALSRNILAKRKDDVDKSHIIVDTLKKNVLKLDQDNRNLRVQVQQLQQKSGSSLLWPKHALEESNTSPEANYQSIHNFETPKRSSASPRMKIKSHDSRLRSSARMNGQLANIKSRGLRSLQQTQGSKKLRGLTGSSSPSSFSGGRKIRNAFTSAQNLGIKPRRLIIDESGESPLSRSSAEGVMRVKSLPGSARKSNGDRIKRQNTVSSAQRRSTAEARRNSAFQKHINRNRLAKVKNKNKSK